MLNNNNRSTPNARKDVDEYETNLESPGDVTSVASFYDNAVVMVTGGTGFLGKTLLEKLLRSCPGIKKIKVLMRPKSNMTVEQRFKELLKHQVFDHVRTKWPERLSKLSPVSGDVSVPNLGVTTSLEDVTVFFHSAASVRFTEPLSTAIDMNIKGTARVLKLAKTMPKLKVFVHISTAYSNAPKSHIEEVVYPPPYDPDSIVRCGQILSPEMVNLIAERIQGEYPNIYTLTKALAESIVVRQKDLPVCIVRPSIELFNAEGGGGLDAVK
ncbi:Putative fatty acyl-CoA reductase CG5065 [Eumeta japonica]|uniref:Fatty acyl-CoA reductase n=1 Tax=Eumeta variegata TaxID=151549 RepID=A0A4C1WE05_EUMVA|nr:Putative fatty acyl-CoA reductase CG5065 [Eumeta japonica]